MQAQEVATDAPFQPYWIAYAKHQGLPPESDELRNVDFIGWINEQRRVFADLHEIERRRWSAMQTRAFGGWLKRHENECYGCDGSGFDAVFEPCDSCAEVTHD